MEIKGRVDEWKTIESVKDMEIRVDIDVKGVITLTEEDRAVDLIVTERGMTRWINVREWKEDLEEIEKNVEEMKKVVKQEVDECIELLKHLEKQGFDLRQMLARLTDDC